MKKKDVSTINYSVSYKSDDQVDTINDSNKQVDPRNDPITETHIVDRVRHLSVRVELFELSVIIGGRIEPVTNVLENSRVEIPLNSLSPLNTNTSKAFVIGLACKSVGVNRNILNCKLPDSRNIQRNNSRIWNPGLNEGVLSTSHDTNSIL